MKSQQFCSVCKEWLDMEVVPTSDGDDDDGVVWFRCPKCQGFLPKLSGADQSDAEATGATEVATTSVDEIVSQADSDPVAEPTGTSVPGESGEGVSSTVAGSTETADSRDVTPEKPEQPAEPIAEYVALLAAADAAEPTPYRPWGTYDIGQCLHHLAWDDCGVVVAREELPGGRRVIKCYFEDAGVVRLIEQEPR